MITNYLGDSVPVALPCSNNPHIHPLGGLQPEIQSFFGGAGESGCDCTEALIWCQLTWSTRWQQSNITLHRNRCTESTSASGHQHALCCEDLLFYDWNILLFLITHSLSSSLPASCPTIASLPLPIITALCCIQLGPRSVL